MTDYRSLYLFLFWEMAKATEESERGKLISARNRLIAAQQEAEERVIYAELAGQEENPHKDSP